MLRLLTGPPDAPDPAADASLRTVELLLDRLYTEGRLTRPEADVLRRALPPLPPRAPAWPASVRAAIIDLDARPAAECPAFVERRLAALDAPVWVLRTLSGLQHHALQRLPDMGIRYQRLRAVLVLLLVT